MEIAGLIYNYSPHYIDHIAPFCSLLRVPLIICEEGISRVVRELYPDLEVIEKELFDLKLPNQVITCDGAHFLRATFPHQTIRTVWLPHGNSDKGWNTPLFEALATDEILLAYGQKMIDLMKQVTSSTIISIGNFRWHYYLKHQSFYEHLLPPPGLLYAPTWDDAENNNSLWKALPLLTDRVKEPLLIKFHPNTIRKFEPELEVLMGRYQRKDIFFLPDLPPIYPLLTRSKAYIGDMSSIGYDFLTFNKPIYFFNTSRSRGMPLHLCGEEIGPQTNYGGLQERLSNEREKMYNYTFNPTPNWEEMRERITR